MVFYFGYQPEKLQACIYFALYTIICRFPLLLAILGSPYPVYLFRRDNLVVLSVCLAFIVKTPIFLVHIWLPKAHVEAPVAGSIVLASVLLKLGSFGFMILGLVFIAETINLFLYLSLIGIVVCALCCLRSRDIKNLIAYSSVVHIGVVTGGVVSGQKLGYVAAIIIVIAHGFCSPIIFASAGEIYKGSHTRTLRLNKGLLCRPAMSVALFFLIGTNIGMPPTVNLWSEILFISRILSLAPLFLVFVIISVFLGALYNLYFYISLVHGKNSPCRKKEFGGPELLLLFGPIWCLSPFFSLRMFIPF